MVAKKAYVFVECLPGKKAEVARNIRKNPAVLVADVVTGPWDVIAILEVPNTQSLARTVLVEIAGVAGVEKTLTSGVITGNFPVLAETVAGAG